MPFVTFDLDDETHARVRAAADRAGLPVEEWLAGLVRKRTRSDWPPELVASFGTWEDFPSAEELRSGSVPDLPREPL